MTNILEKLEKIRRAAHNSMWYSHPDRDDRKEAYTAITDMIKEFTTPPTQPEQGVITYDNPSPSSRGTSRGRPRSTRTSDTTTDNE